MLTAVIIMTLTVIFGMVEVDIFDLFRARRTRWEASVPHCPPSSGVGDAESARALLPKALRGFNEVPLRMLRVLGSVKRAAGSTRPRQTAATR